MERMMATVAGLLVIVVILPSVAAAAQSVTPLLIGLLIALALLRAMWSGGRRR